MKGGCLTQKMISQPNPKPDWLRKKLVFGEQKSLTTYLKENGINTVCQEARCPNITECFCKQQATFLILGPICTRHCSFCNVSKGKPEALDSTEPQRVAEAVKMMNLRYVVLTSSTRDDLPDGGAQHFYECIEAIKEVDGNIKVEVLIPDFQGNEAAIQTVVQSRAEMIAHNVETVPRLYRVRKGADYQQSLDVMKTVKKLDSARPVKSGIMLGLGEEESEVYSVMQDLLDYGCEYLSIGQYLAPSKNHVPVVEYVHPDQFDAYREKARSMGFKYIKSSPYTRSSYLAEEYIV